MPEDRAPQTIAASNGITTDRTFGTVAPPLYLSSTFAFAGFEQARNYDYTRTANPSGAMLADTIANLEGRAGGVVAASGIATVDLVLSQLESDALIVAPHDCYTGTYRLLAARRDKQQFDVAFVDQGVDAALANGFDRSPALILIEMPSNPLMCIVDIRAVAARATPLDPGSWSTTRFCHLRCSSRSPLARTSPFIPPPNISMGTLTWLAAS